MSAGTRSSAITAAAPASSAILAWSALTTSMITPPFNISARPTFTRNDSWEFIGFPSVLVPSHYRSGQDRARSRLDFANGFGQQGDARFDVPPLDARDGESNVRPILPRRIEVLPRRDPDSPGRGRLGHAAAGDSIGQMEPGQRIGAVAAPPRDLGQVPGQRLGRVTDSQRDFLSAPAARLAVGARAQEGSDRGLQRHGCLGVGGPLDS